MIFYIPLIAILVIILFASEAGRSFLGMAFVSTIAGGLILLCLWAIGGDALLGNGFVRYFIIGFSALIGAAGIFVALRSIFKLVFYSIKKSFTIVPPDKKIKLKVAVKEEIRSQHNIESRPEIAAVETIKNENTEPWWEGIGRYWAEVKQEWEGMKRDIKYEVTGKKEGTIEVEGWSRKELSVKAGKDPYRTLKVLAVTVFELILFVLFLFLFLSVLFH